VDFRYIYPHKNKSPVHDGIDVNECGAGGAAVSGIRVAVTTTVLRGPPLKRVSCDTGSASLPAAAWQKPKAPAHISKTLRSGQRRNVSRLIPSQAAEITGSRSAERPL
jgi:hypothetical protein